MANSGSSDVESQKTYTYLQEVETVAQDILTFKDMKLELSNAQNKFRESLRAIEHSDERNFWMKEGSVYISRPKQECILYLRKGKKYIINFSSNNLLLSEMEKSQGDITDLQNIIRDKLNESRDLEHEPRIIGFGLKALSSKEAKSLHKGFGSA